MSENLKPLVWVKVSNGTYRTACGRFRINRSGSRSKKGYTLHDTTRKDLLCPQYDRFENCDTIEAAKRKADRWYRGGF